MKFDISVALKQANSKLDAAMLEAFIEVESGGKGFDTKTGKIIIQFEPAWFKKLVANAHGGVWSINKIDLQPKEWEAFNDAFAIDQDGAMEATSIGLPQIMGYHWKRLGYDSVGHMWDDFKASLVNQIVALIRFIETDPILLKAFKNKDWHKMALMYNGIGYAAQANNLGIKSYNLQLKEAYERISTRDLA